MHFGRSTGIRMFCREVIFNSYIVQQSQYSSFAHIDRAIAFGVISSIAIPVFLYCNTLLKGHRGVVRHRNNRTISHVCIRILIREISHPVVNQDMIANPGGIVSLSRNYLAHNTALEYDEACSELRMVSHSEHSAPVNALLAWELRMMARIADYLHWRVFIALDEDLVIVT